MFKTGLGRELGHVQTTKGVWLPKGQGCGTSPFAANIAGGLQKSRGSLEEGQQPTEGIGHAHGDLRHLPRCKVDAHGHGVGQGYICIRQILAALQLAGQTPCSQGGLRYNTSLTWHDG